MHNNYYVLNLLAKELNEKLLNRKILDCYTQNKSELCIQFDDEFYLKAHLQPQFPILLFPNALHRAKRNSTGIFTGLLEATVLSCNTIKYDRSMVVSTTKGNLLFKMHGSRSNVLFYPAEAKDNRPELFKTKLSQDAEIKLADLGMPLPDYDQFVAEHGDLRKLFPVVGKEIRAYFFESGYEALSVEEKWKTFNELHTFLSTEAKVKIVDYDTEPKISLINSSENERIPDTCQEALTVYFYHKIRLKNFRSKQSSLISSFSQQLDKTLSYLQKTRSRLKEIKKEDDFKYRADVLMANIYQLKQARGKVTLKGFMGEDMTFDLRDKPASAWAEKFYRKSKNRKIEVEKLTDNIKAREKDYQILSEELDKVKKAENLEEIKDLGSGQEQKQTNIQSNRDLYYHEFKLLDFVIRVGKSSKNNDRLSFENGYKEDLWLHVKDAPGSHVLIKYRSEKKFPEPVIQAAAETAAFFSKRKTEGLVPVIVTPRKFIRKRKGDPPGAVIVDREEVILVEPKSHLDT